MKAVVTLKWTNPNTLSTEVQKSDVHKRNVVILTPGKTVRRFVFPFLAHEK